MLKPTTALYKGLIFASASAISFLETSPIEAPLIFIFLSLIKLINASKEPKESAFKIIPSSSISKVVSLICSFICIFIFSKSYLQL